MPELYGNPFKWELRKELRETRIDRRQKLKELIRSRSQLDYANCKIAALEAKIQRMEQLTRALLVEAGRDIKNDIWQRFMGPSETLAA
jgi:hypothetical protein